MSVKTAYVQPVHVTSASGPFYARSEVSQLGSFAIEPEHLLLGVLAERNGLGSRILAHTGGTLDDLRSDIVRRSTSRERISEPDEIPFSASSERVLQYAADEADRLLHDAMGTEHLLLGLLREERSVAAEALAARGLRIEAVREAIVKLLSNGEQSDPPGPPATPANTYQWPQVPFVPSRTVPSSARHCCAARSSTVPGSARAGTPTPASRRRAPRWSARWKPRSQSRIRSWKSPHAAAHRLDP